MCVPTFAFPFYTCLPFAAGNYQISVLLLSEKKSLLLQCSRIFSSKREQFAPEVWEHGWLLPPAVLSIIQGTVIHNVYTSVNKNLSTRLMIPRPCFFPEQKTKGCVTESSLVEDLLNIHNMPMCVYDKQVNLKGVQCHPCHRYGKSRYDHHPLSHQLNG